MELCRCSEGGIGHELALQLHARGALSKVRPLSASADNVLTGLRVFATARSLASMEQWKALGIETLELDVTVSSSIQSVKAAVEKMTNGALDILINNAYAGKF